MLQDIFLDRRQDGNAQSQLQADKLHPSFKGAVWSWSQRYCNTQTFIVVWICSSGNGWNDPLVTLYWPLKFLLSLLGSIECNRNIMHLKHQLSFCSQISMKMSKTYCQFYSTQNLNSRSDHMFINYWHQNYLMLILAK